MVGIKTPSFYHSHPPTCRTNNIPFSIALVLVVLGILSIHHPPATFPIHENVSRNCSNSSVAVDSHAHPCVSLHNLTDRTFIHRVRASDAVYMYCSIPKNGCSYHIDLMHRVNNDFFPGPAKHLVENKQKIILSDSDEAAFLLANHHVPKYMIIRNPLTRVLSGYLCKIEQFLPLEEQTPENFQKWARNEFTNFTWSNINSHWKAQTTFCGYDIRDVQSRFSVFRVENPEEYVEFIYTFVPRRVLDQGWGTGPNLTDFRSFVLGPRKRTGHTEEKFNRYVGSVEFFDFLEKTFERDIHVLGYVEEVAQMRRNLLLASAKSKPLLSG